MIATRTRFILLLLASTLLAACAATTPDVSVAPSLNEPPASEPDTTADPCVPGFVCSGELLPGEYRSTSTGATVTFALAGAGWSGSEDIPGEGFALFNDAVGGTHGISVVAYDGEVYTDVCSGGPREQIGGVPSDLIRFIATVEGVQAEAPGPATVGGQSAFRLDLTTDSPCPDDQDFMWLWGFPEGRDFHLNDAERARVYALETGGATIVIVIEAFPDADYDLLLQKADEVLATMTIGPGS